MFPTFQLSAWPWQPLLQCRSATQSKQGVCKCGQCWENRYPQMRSQSVLFIVAWEQAPENMLLEGESGLPTDLLLAT